MTKIITTIFLLLLISCGKAVEDKKDDPAPEEETYSDGTYVAFFIPVNGLITNQIDGEVKISRYGDDFEVKVQLRNAPAGMHKQYLHEGTSCPKQAHDDNRDGYIDGYEAREAMGYILVPFDGDLSSQSRGDTFFPSGNYRYTRSTSYYLMLSDLHLPDEIVNDSITKLNTRDLPLEQRAVSIYSKSPVGEIPVACGILTRVSENPPPDSDQWEERVPSPSPRPGPRPTPRPAPIPDPPPEPDENNGSWWDNIRRRWDEWWYGRGT